MDSTEHTHESQELGTLRFTFVVMADTHVNQGENVSTSPYACNRLANPRARYAIREINRLSPAFVIHLGDMVHPVPALATYGQAAENFHELAKDLKCKLHLVPGNHDVGDKPVTWMPAGRVCDKYITQYERYFGEHFFAFDSNGSHFVVINAPILNSGLACEAIQKAWLEQNLAENAGKRLFLCIHYPPYVTEPNERGSYDNIDEPGRSWLLRLVETYRPEALFSAHVHNFIYNRYANTECYVLPSISFVRQDYSEFFRVEPGDEYGRNDSAKLGYFVVKVYEKGHVCHVVRTCGATLQPDQPFEPAPIRLVARHTKENRIAPVGVDLRHPWAEITGIPPTGAVDAFERKKARNDYSLLALWEMGIRKLRVPIQDLADPDTRDRMGELKDLGHEFTVYTYGVPRADLRDVLIGNCDLVDAWEAVIHQDELDGAIAEIKAMKREAPLTVFLSTLRSRDDAAQDGTHYNHCIDHGFLLSESDSIDTLLGREEVLEVIDGLAFRLYRDVSPFSAIPEIDRIAKSHGLKAAVELRMVSGNPAEPFFDDLANANRVAEAAFAALAVRDVAVFVDSLVDIDRGYFVRTGLVDRRYNPRLAGHVLRNLYSAINAGNGETYIGSARSATGGRMFTLNRPRETTVLILPEPELTIHEIFVDTQLEPESGTGSWIDLETGVITSVGWERVRRTAGPQIRLTPSMRCKRPSLFVFAV